MRSCVIANSSCPALESSVYGLNLTVPEDAKEIIKPWDEREDNDKYLDSNVDDQVRWLAFPELGSMLTIYVIQLIIHVPFVENVRIKSILLKLGKHSI